MKSFPPIVVALLVSGCVLGPNYSRPQTPAAAAGSFVATTGAAQFSAAPPPSRWWHLYEDAALDGYVEQALAANTDLRVASANLERARAVLSETRGARLPSTVITGGGSYVRSSNAGGGGLAARTSAYEGQYYTAGLDVSYELDLFGRVRRSIQAARADAAATEATRDTVRVTVAAETTRAYADACATAAQLAVAQQSLKVQNETFALTERLYTAGRDTPLDVDRARALVEATRATLPTFAADRRAALYRLAVLTGQAPEVPLVAAEACARPPRLTAPLPVGDGTALLQRRPDIRQADRTLAAATARIGVAIAALYPQVTLGGAVSNAALSVGGLGSSAGLSFNIGPAITWTFPNVTVARARILQARASNAAALASFDGTVLGALRDTETALSALAAETERYQSLKASRDFNAEAVRIVSLRYGAGRENFLAVLDAQRTLANAEAALAASEAALSTDRINVFKHLGGGWDAAPLH